MNYYIQGSANRADKIKAAFEELGYDTKHYTFDNDNLLFYTINGDYIPFLDGRIMREAILINIIKTHPDYKELELQIEPKFKVGDWITDGTCKVKITDINNTYYWFSKNCILGEIEFIDKKYHLWTMRDAKDGDVLALNGKPFIYSHKYEKNYCYIDSCEQFRANLSLVLEGNCVCPATKEQRDLLFAKMKEEGYEWDERKKELRKIIEPKFKVGDGIKTGVTIDKIAEIDHATRRYYCESGRTISFENQDMWHLVPKPHYDIANFKPFDKVLVRQNDSCTWGVSFFGRCSGGMFICCSNACFTQCIPFEGNEHLLGTTDMCPEEYINW